MLVEWCHRPPVGASEMGAQLAVQRVAQGDLGEVKQRMHGGCCYAVGSLVVNRGGGEFIRERFTG